MSSIKIDENQNIPKTPYEIKCSMSLISRRSLMEILKDVDDSNMF